MTASVVPFQSFHAEEIMAGQHIEQWATHGPRLEQIESYTLELDGRPSVATGVIELWPGVGEAWMLTSNLIQQHPIVVARAIKRGLFEHIKEKNYWRVQANVAVGWVQAEKFAAFVGMENEGLMPKFGPKMEDHYRYAWVK